MFSGGGGSNATAVQGVQINASNYGKPLPIVYGQNRVATNAIWYNDFQAHAQQQGGKGGGGATSYTYTAAVMMAICEGQIGGVNRIFKSRQVIVTDASGNTPLQQESLTFSNGSPTQPVWSYLSSNHSDQALAYAGTAWVANGNLSLDSSAGLPNYNFEILGQLQTANPYNSRGTWSSASTYNPGDYVVDPANSQPYVCFAQVGPTSTHPNQAAGYLNQTGTYWWALGSTTPDANPADIIPDLLTNTRYGAGFPSSSIGDLSNFRNYCTAAGFFFSPVVDQQQQVQQYLSDWTKWANSAIVWSQAQLKIIPYGDQSLTGNGVTWNPNNTPVFNFTDDDYITGGTVSGANQQTDPIMVARGSASDAYNDLKLEFLDRSNNYNSFPAEAMDQAAIDQYGLRTGSTITAHGICAASVAQLAVQLLLQRGLYIRNTYTFTVPTKYCLAEPMDIVTLSGTLEGYNQLPVRITAIEEDDKLNLKITAEDFILGVGTAIPQATAPNLSGGNGNAAQAPPGDVATPVFFNVPAALVGSNAPGWLGVSPTQSLQLGVAVAGSSPNWGGCQVWVSVDGTTYKQVGTINRSAAAGSKVSGSPGIVNTGSRYGSLTADFPLHADPDTTDTLSVDMSASNGTLQSATTGQAAVAATLSLLGGTECVSYTTSTLTGPNAYNLTGTIRRGQARTPIADHPIGSSFVRLDDSIFKYNYVAEQIGTTIYVKFLSFNLFGAQLQSLASVSPYTVTLAPAVAIPGAVTGLAVVSWTGTNLNLSWNPSANATSYTVQVYKSDGVTLLRTATTATTAYTYTRDYAVADGDIERSYVVKVTANSSAGSSSPASVTATKPAPAAVTGVTSSGSGASVTVSWGASTQGDAAGYAAYYSTSNGFTPPGAGTQFYSGIATSVALPGLTPGTTYYLRVACYDQWSSDPTALTFSAQYSFTD